MSRWRREASERLPEWQRIIASDQVESPMMLWIELAAAFKKICESEEPDIGLQRRVWGYCGWCLDHGNDDVSTAAALGFCEHLMDSPRVLAVLPRIMTKAEFAGIRPLLEYHNSPEEVEACLRKYWP